MKKIGYGQKQNSERSDPYILLLTGIHNLIFVDFSLAGMPIRTLLLLLTDFLCIAVYLYKGERILPYWKKSGVYEKMMIALLSMSVLALVVSALADADYFWIGVDIVVLLLVFPCIYGREKFPQDIFGVHSVCSCVTCVLLLCYYLADGICEPFIALLLENNAVVPWLVLSITMDVIAYCFQEKGQIWYGGNILLAAFLLAIQKNVPGMVITGMVPLMLPLFCRPSKVLVGRAAHTELLYTFLICNMSLITGYTPLSEKIVKYDLQISVYMELMLAAMGVWFFEYWDKYVQNEDENTTVPKMREWCRKAITACLVSGIGIYAAVELFWTDDTSGWKEPAQVIMNAAKANPGWKSGLFGQMGQRCGILGIGIVCVLFYIGIMRIRSTKGWHVKAHKLYRLIAAVYLLQAAFLPQTMVSMPVYVVFFFLFMGAEEERQQKKTMTVSDHGEWRETNETDYTDTLFQRGGDPGDRIE